MNWRKLSYFAAHRLIGSRVENYYKEFLALHHGPAEKINELRQDRLRQLLQRARAEILFYRERAIKKGLELSDYPILTKNDLVNHYTDFMSGNLKKEYYQKQRRFGYSWVEVKSGGSTGTPVTVIHDKDFRDRGRASRLFSQYLCDFPLGVPYFLLWGSMKEINQMKDSLSKKALVFLLHYKVFNAFRMDQAHLQNYIAEINRSSAQHMMAYVDAADEMVRFAARQQIPLRQLQSLMACAGTVTEEIRSRLQRGLTDRVHNKYGTRECTDIACEDENGNFLIYGHHVHLEIVDENGAPVSTGTPGRILVTLLGNHSFPIIRYELGDIGALKADKEGIPWPLLDSVHGRKTDFVSDTRGNYVSPVYIRHLIGVVHNPEAIERFKLRQTGAMNYDLFLQLQATINDTAAASIFEKIEKDLRTVLGKDSKIKIERVDRIAESASGKFIPIENLYRKKAS